LVQHHVLVDSGAINCIGCRPFIDDRFAALTQGWLIDDLLAQIRRGVKKKSALPISADR
jgi:hypothetical protein